MKVRSVIIDSLNLELMDSDISKLLSHIDNIVTHKRNPIVLINEHGDDLLRKIPRLFDCDLVYSQKNKKKYEGLFVGIQGAGTCAFYMPLNAEYGDEKLWLEMEKTLVTLEYKNNIHLIVPTGLGPWLITPVGMQYLKTQGPEYDLENDNNLNKLEVPKR